MHKALHQQLTLSGHIVLWILFHIIKEPQMQYMMQIPQFLPLSRSMSEKGKRESGINRVSESQGDLYYMSYLLTLEHRLKGRNYVILDGEILSGPLQLVHFL